MHFFQNLNFGEVPWLQIPLSVWLLIRSYRERLSLVAADQVDVESSALLLALICGAVLLVAVVASPSLATVPAASTILSAAPVDSPSLSMAPVAPR